MLIRHSQAPAKSFGRERKSSRSTESSQSQKLARIYSIQMTVKTEGISKRRQSSEIEEITMHKCNGKSRMILETHISEA